MKNTCIFILLLLTLACRAQSEMISGFVYCIDTRERLSYVNIGVVNRSIGTVSDGKGNFTLSGSNVTHTDTVRFSCIGYTPVSISVGQLIRTGNQGVALKPSSVELKEVVIRAAHLKHQDVGSKTTAKFLMSGLGSGDLGGEIGALINLPKGKFLLDSVNFFLISNSFDSVYLRLNIYSAGGEFPKVSLLRENVIIPIMNKRRGWISFDLSKHSIELSDDFIATLELIEHSKKKGAIYLSQAPPYLKPMYYRNTSHDKVKVYRGGPLGIYFRVIKTE